MKDASKRSDGRFRLLLAATGAVMFVAHLIFLRRARRRLGL
jgi:hypothetical protein